jgi:hypothetical protein
MSELLSNAVLIIGSASARAWARLTNAWRTLVSKHAQHYRPEAHYMRGPGPKWRAKRAQGLTEG